MSKNGVVHSPPELLSSVHRILAVLPAGALVARCLTNLQDFFALRAVCRTYRALLPLTSSNLASQAPLLLVPWRMDPKPSSTPPSA